MALLESRSWNSDFEPSSDYFPVLVLRCRALASALLAGVLMIRGSRLFSTVAVVIATAMASTSAEACAVCFGGENNNRWAFIGTTALLTFLPLIIFGSGVVWFRKQFSDDNAPIE